jgi:hypothetical protein
MLTATQRSLMYLFFLAVLSTLEIDPPRPQEQGTRITRSYGQAGHHLPCMPRKLPLPRRPWPQRRYTSSNEGAAAPPK